MINASAKTKKWACVGGALVVAGVGAWGLGDFKKIDTENMSAPLSYPAPPSQISDAQPAAKDAKTEAVPPTTLALKTHVVKNGDTLSAIAAAYNIDVDTILGANPETDEVIYPGEELKILPAKGVFYEVKAGDTLWRIGQNYSITVETLVKANQKTTDQVLAGENIFIPGARYSRVDSRTEQRAQPVASRARPRGFSWPVGGELSSPFGWRWGRFHAGVDIANDTGAPVMAAGAGQVVWAGEKGGYGYAVMIDHNNGYITLYGHLDDYFVEKGQYVRKGQRIASVGNTGNSTGPHLHFEVLHDGEHVDPLGILP